MSVEENLVLKATEDDRFSNGKGFFLKKKAIHDYALKLQKKNDIRCSSVMQEARNLSGGNQQKIILARELDEEPDLMVAVHPTRGLDIGATGYVHDCMIQARDAGCAILLISADFDEILKLSDRIIVMLSLIHIWRYLPEARKRLRLWDQSRKWKWKQRKSTKGIGTKLLWM